MRTRRLTNNHHYGHSFHFPIPPPPPPPHSPTSESKWYSIIFLSRNDVIGHECVTDLCHQYSILLKIYFKKRQKKDQKNQRNQPRGSIRIQHPIQSVSIIHPNQHLSRLTSPQKVRPPSELQPGSGVRPRGLHPGSVHPSVRASPGFRPSVRRGFTRVSGVRPLRLAGGNQNRPWGWTWMALDSSFQCPYPSATLSRAIKHCGPSLLWFQTIIKYQWSIKTILPVTLKKYI